MTTAEIAPNQVRELKLQWWLHDAINDLVSDVVVFTGGFGIGKSYALCMLALERALTLNTDSDSIFIEPQFSLIATVAEKTFEHVAETVFGLRKNIDFKINRTGHTYKLVLYNGHTIYFLSGENPDRIVGFNTVSNVYLDEAFLMKQDVFDKASARARHKLAKKCQVFLGGTPEGMNWGADLFDSDTQNDWIRETPTKHYKETISLVDGEPVKRRITRYRATTMSNSANLAPGYVATILERFAGKQNFIDSYIYGYFRPFTTGLAYCDYDPSQHRVTDFERSPQLPIHLTFDFNICPVWVAIQNESFIDSLGKRGSRSVAYDNCTGSFGDQLEDSVVEFATRHPVKKYRNTPIYIYGDPTGYAKSHKVKACDFDNIKKMLGEIGYKNVAITAIKAAWLERTAVDAVNREFADNKLHIAENCEVVIRSLSRTTWASGARNKLDKPQSDTWTHPMDAVKYYICANKDQKFRRVIHGRTR